MLVTAQERIGVMSFSVIGYLPTNQAVDISLHPSIHHRITPLPVFHAPRSSYEEKNKSDQGRDRDPQAMMFASQADSPAYIGKEKEKIYVVFLSFLLGAFY